MSSFTVKLEHNTCALHQAPSMNRSSYLYFSVRMSHYGKSWTATTVLVSTQIRDWHPIWIAFTNCNDDNDVESLLNIIINKFIIFLSFNTKNIQERLYTCNIHVSILFLLSLIRIIVISYRYCINFVWKETVATHTDEPVGWIWSGVVHSEKQENDMDNFCVCYEVRKAVFLNGTWMERLEDKSHLKLIFKGCTATSVCGLNNLAKSEWMTSIFIVEGRCIPHK